MLFDLDYYHKLNNVVADPGYREHVMSLMRLMKMSRFPVLKRTHWITNATQVAIIKRIVQYEDAVARGRAMSEQSTSDKEHKSYLVGIRINRNLARICRTIADGIAWRNFDFNRPLLRLLSGNKYAGVFPADYAEFYRRILVGSRYVTIICDSTRFLRIGDVIRIYPEGQRIIFEFKKGGKRRKDMEGILADMRKYGRWANRQELRHLIAQDAIISGLIRIPVMTEEGRVGEVFNAQIREIKTPVRHHYRKIRGCIRRANQSCFSSCELEPGFYVEFTAIDRWIDRGADEMGALFEKHKTSSEKSLPTWVKDKNKHVVRFASLDLAYEKGGEFIRNVAPFSVFPLRARDCLRLMSGHLQFIQYFDLQALADRFRQRGWNVEDQIEQSLAVHAGQRSSQTADVLESATANDLPDTLFVVSKRFADGRLTCEVPLTLFFWIATSFYTFDFLVDVYEELGRIGPSSSNNTPLTTFNLLGEQRVLT